MRDWYCAVLGAAVIYENDHLCFATYDDEHHRVAFVNFGPLAPKDTSTHAGCGVLRGGRPGAGVGSALSRATGEGYAQMLTQRLAALGSSIAELIPTDSLTAQKRLVEAGFGLGLMPESSVQEELRLGTLRALPLSAMRLGVPVVLVHRRRAFLSGAARAVIAMLRDG
jgi:hypothetical protein